MEIQNEVDLKIYFTTINSAKGISKVYKKKKEHLENI